MADSKSGKMSQKMKVSLILAALAAGLFGILVLQNGSDPESTAVTGTEPAPEAVHQKIDPETVVDMSESTTDTMTERKKQYGLDEGVDIVVKSDETLKIGDRTLKMRDYEEQQALGEGRIVASDLTGRSSEASQEYGIHLVRKGDNLWNLHFKLLQEYYAKRGILVEIDADEPDRRGKSSGVGKLLKFSERMVRIYNLKEQNFATNLDLLEPSEKIVVYNMSEVTGLLDSIDYSTLDKIRFDGNQLWIPSS